MVKPHRDTDVEYQYSNTIFNAALMPVNTKRYQKAGFFFQKNVRLTLKGDSITLQGHHI
ncbi:hypothetical protein CI610_03420 [invertebrate metagenome]|uniref:Uncharacterized protein n=1 Tax=invertebrate metagenome TaxID=1711999 RepID=A0A2H9T379_9ZZZZ